MHLPPPFANISLAGLASVAPVDGEDVVASADGDEDEEEVLPARQEMLFAVGAWRALKIFCT